MNDVCTAASRHPVVLVTGFGPFPGAPTNPTLGMLRRLEGDGVEGVDLAFARLPVTFAGVRPALREAAAGCRPDAVLLLGLARRRSMLNIETLARNTVGRATADTDGALPAGTLVEGAPDVRHATWPAAAILAALRGAGHEATLSTDAGDYVCNAALFHALGDRLAPSVGFLHVPPTDDAGPGAEALAAAARVVIGVLAYSAASTCSAAAG